MIWPSFAFSKLSWWNAFWVEKHTHWRKRNMIAVKKANASRSALRPGEAPCPVRGLFKLTLPLWEGDERSFPCPLAPGHAQQETHAASQEVRARSAGPCLLVLFPSSFHTHTCVFSRNILVTCVTRAFQNDRRSVIWKQAERVFVSLGNSRIVRHHVNKNQV